MDFGCGSGKNVETLRNQGYLAFGCDVNFKTDNKVNTKVMHDNQVIRLIPTESYILPFEDNTFDVILSDQVFEHVQNYSVALAEIKRILKPDGVCLHVFPSKYKPMESHVYAPFSSIIKSHAWLYFWAKLGIRKSSQKELPAKEVAIINTNYLKKNTNYLSKKSIKIEFKKHFKSVVFCEDLFFKVSHRARHLNSLSKVFPFLPSLYSTFHSRVVLARDI